MTQEANGLYLGPKHLKHTILIYSQFIENGQAKLGQHYCYDALSCIKWTMARLVS